MQKKSNSKLADMERKFDQTYVYMYTCRLFFAERRAVKGRPMKLLINKILWASESASSRHMQAIVYLPKAYFLAIVGLIGMPRGHGLL